MEILSRREREKIVHKDEIIKAAEKLFYKKGFENTSMDEIAKEAEFTKRTIYQYFTSKEDLFFAIAFKGFKIMASYFQKAGQKGKNAFEKIRLSFLAYYDFYKDHPETFRLMNYIGYVKKKNTPQEKEWLKFDDELFNGIAFTINEGIKDGSIRKDINKDMTTYILAFLSTGFFRQLSETGETFTKHFNLDIDNFVKEGLDFILKSIKN